MFSTYDVILSALTDASTPMTAWLTDDYVLSWRIHTAIITDDAIIGRQFWHMIRLLPICSHSFINGSFSFIDRWISQLRHWLALVRTDTTLIDRFCSWMSHWLTARSYRWGSGGRGCPGCQRHLRDAAGTRRQRHEGEDGTLLGHAPFPHARHPQSQWHTIALKADHPLFDWLRACVVSNNF